MNIYSYLFNKTDIIHRRMTAYNTYNNDDFTSPRQIGRRDKVDYYVKGKKKKNVSKKKKIEEKTYCIFDFKGQLIGTWTPEECEKFFKRSWITIKPHLRKKTRINGMYFIRYPKKP